MSTGLPREEDLKQMAYAIKQLTGVKLGHCYEEIAKQYGFNSYAALREEMKKRGLIPERRGHEH